MLWMCIRHHSFDKINWLKNFSKKKKIIKSLIKIFNNKNNSNKNFFTKLIY